MLLQFQLRNPLSDHDVIYDKAYNKPFHKK